MSHIYFVLIYSYTKQFTEFNHMIFQGGYLKSQNYYEKQNALLEVVYGVGANRDKTVMIRRSSCNNCFIVLLWN